MFDTYIQSGIISSQDLHMLMQELGTRLRLVDATFVLPGSTENPRDIFEQMRIGSAVFFDVDDVADKNTPLPHMLPKHEIFEKSMSNLGIGNDDFVVVYGQGGIVLGPPRLWWMLKVFGHDNVVVLDGGLPAWQAAGFKVMQAQPIAPAPAVFKTREYRQYMITDMLAVQSASESESCPIIDARPLDRFTGEASEPREGMRSGHIPSSISLPCSALIDPQTGQMKDKISLKSLFEEKDINFSTPPSRIITTCGSGITACVIALALFRLGYNNFCVYDGSWSEWGGSDSSARIARADSA